MVVTVPLPDYTVERKPDHATIGRRVDDVIREHFAGRTIVARAISADDHPHHSVDELIKIIEITGHDRYDPQRAGDRYGNRTEARIDLFGMRRRVGPGMTLFSRLSWGFYHGSIEIHGHPVRLDLLTVYDSARLRAVLHQYEGRSDRKRDGFRFVDPARAADSVFGILKLGR